MQTLIKLNNLKSVYFMYLTEYISYFNILNKRIKKTFRLPHVQPFRDYNLSLRKSYWMFINLEEDWEEENYEDMCMCWSVIAVLKPQDSCNLTRPLLWKAAASPSPRSSSGFLSRARPAIIALWCSQHR